MSLLYNGSPVPLKANAEGVPYVIESKKTLFEPSAFRAQVLLNQLGALGLKEIQSKDDIEDADPECLGAFQRHVEAAIIAFNDHRSEQKRQGLRAPVPSDELVRRAGIYAKLGGTARLAGVGGTSSSAVSPAAPEDDEDDSDEESAGALRTRRSAGRGGKRR